MSRRDKYLRAIWNQPNNSNVRFIPKSFVGGPGWGVFDRQAGTFIELKDLMRLTLEEVVSARVSHS